MSQIAAIFDVDGTLMRGGSERLFFRYLWRQGQLTTADAARFLWGLARRPGGRFQDKTYLAGQEVADITALARRCYRERLAARLRAGGLRVLRAHQAQGHVLVILTGTLAVLAQPLQEDLGVQWLIATELTIRDGRCTGEIEGFHPRGANKALLLRRLAADQDFDLEKSFAYADDSMDAPLLGVVGRPVVVNPSWPLRRLARRHGWRLASF